MLPCIIASCIEASASSPAEGRYEGVVAVVAPVFRFGVTALGAGGAGSTRVGAEAVVPLPGWGNCRPTAHASPKLSLATWRTLGEVRLVLQLPTSRRLAGRLGENVLLNSDEDLGLHHPSTLQSDNASEWLRCLRHSSTRRVVMPPTAYCIDARVNSMSGAKARSSELPESARDKKRSAESLYSPSISS